MKYAFKELVDIPTLQNLTDELYKATGIASAIVTISGEVLTGSGWQKICTDFHRKHPQIEKECTESDIKVRKKLEDGEAFVMYECPRGLVDASSPVIIEGEHVANVFAGQIFTEPPTNAKEQFFRQQAKKFGFDEEAYMEAFRLIPVMPEEKFRFAISFLSKLAQLLAQLGFARARELRTVEEARIKLQELQEEKHFFDFMINSLPGLFYYFDEQGRFLKWNKNLEKMTGFSENEINGMKFLDFFDEPEKGIIADAIAEVFKNGKVIVEADLLTKDGKRIPHMFSGSRIELQHKPHLIGMGIDLSAVKEAQKIANEKMIETEKLNKFMMGREVRIIELKREIDILLKEIGKSPKYKA